MSNSIFLWGREGGGRKGGGSSAELGHLEPHVSLFIKR